MGSGLRKPAPDSAYAVHASGETASTPASASAVGAHGRGGGSGTDKGGGGPNTTTAAAADDEQLDREEELAAQREEQAAQRQKAAVSHVVEHLFPYAPVRVQPQKYPPSSPHAGQAYLWVSLDEDEIRRRGGPASPIRYPVGVAVDADGNVFISESPGAATAAAKPDSPTRRLSAASIMVLAATNQAPPAPKAPRLVLAGQSSLVVRWKKAADTTVDRYEVQYRAADSAHSAWATLTAVPAARDVALDGVPCHTPFAFRVRAHNPAGWSEFSTPSDAFWTLPGAPSTPRAPVAGTLTNTYINLFWSPSDANGAPPVVYALELREAEIKAASVGHGKAFVPIYEGTACSFVATALHPNTAYVFRLQASNTVGSTVFVESKPIKTLAHGRPEIVELTSSEQSAAYDRWVQCWDPKTEQVFYFNKYTCQRVTDEPRELAEMREKKGATSVEETPEMLFRRKRFRFHRDLRQGFHGVNFGGTLPIQLRRESMYEDTIATFGKLSKHELAAKPRITFENEAGIDSGGLTKDWYLQISKLATAKMRCLFKPCDRGHFEIDSRSSRNAKLLPDFKFLGKFMAKAIFDRQSLDLPMCDATFKHLLQQSPTMDDLRDMDAQYHKSLVWMLENDIADVIDETFSVQVESVSGAAVIEDLKENGRDIPVTDLNKLEYVQLMLQWRTEFGVKAQIDAIMQGFSTLIPLASLQVFDLQELRMLMNGKPTIDVEELRASTVFQGGYDEHSQVVLWLWQAPRSFTLEMRGLFLKFMTGTTKIPLDGFEPPLNITKSDLDPQALPRTHTCFNQIVLPDYTSYQTLVDKITFAITNAEGFELS